MKRAVATSASPEEATPNISKADVKAAVTGKPRKAKPPQAGQNAKILPLEIAKLSVTIVGDTPLCCHAWSKKAVEMMLAKQMGMPTTGREDKDPVVDYAESLYWISKRPEVLTMEAIARGQFGFPANGVKAAMVTAANDAGLVKTEMRRAFHTVGIPSQPMSVTVGSFQFEFGGSDLIPIQGKVSHDVRTVRVGMGTADIRVRGIFEPGWKMKVPLRYDTSVINADQLVNLLNRAGFGVGLGEWRSEKDGQWGLYHVEIG